jgi:hypothetical protein
MANVLAAAKRLHLCQQKLWFKLLRKQLEGAEGSSFREETSSKVLLLENNCFKVDKVMFEWEWET